MKTLTSSADFRDNEKTTQRYEDAAKALKKCLECHNVWKPPEELSKAPKTIIDLGNSIREVREGVSQILSTRENRDLDSKHYLERAFSATSPFAKVFLEVAKEGAAVCSSLFSN